jgi:6-phosphogluconolactonase
MYIKKTRPGSFLLTASDIIKNKLATLLETHDSINVALAGGSTPMPILNLLAKENLDWKKISFYQTDERIVSINDNSNNFRNLSEAFFDHIESNAYPMFKGEQSAENACECYIKELNKMNQKEGLPIFDLIILGMGEDGHIASLFPGSSLLTEKKTAVLLDPIKRNGVFRMTLSFPVLINASNTILLMSGSKKINLFESKKEMDNLPINHLIHNNKNITVICSED